jgi:predicted transposase/invertase (TIGR01784 family)
VETEDGMVIDVEMQAASKSISWLPKRTRYYQAMIDLNVLGKGKDYIELKKSFVIFICNFDKYGQGRAIYTFQNWCDQDKRLLMGDRATKVVVNVTGWTDKNISPELREVLHYLDDGTIGSAYTQELDDAVQELIHNEERGHEYMMTLERYGAEMQSLGEYVATVKQIRKWLKKNGNDAVPSAEYLDNIDISLFTFNSVRSVIKEHPDWDNEQVVDEADWDDDFDEE